MIDPDDEQRRYKSHRQAAQINPLQDLLGKIRDPNPNGLKMFPNGIICTVPLFSVTNDALYFYTHFHI